MLDILVPFLTQDFIQEIMMLAKNAKSMVYEVSLKMLKLVDTIKVTDSGPHVFLSISHPLLLI
jgi:hypothetical protein